MGLGDRDVVFAGAGDDDVMGGGGADMLYGDDGNDRILGENGNDFINGGAGRDAVFGGSGDDIIVAEQDDGDDTYYGDDMVGGHGNDTLDMSAITAAITADLGTGFLGRGSVESIQTGSDTVWGIENIIAGSGNDRITASGAVNVIDGGGGEDVFRFLSAAHADGDTIIGFEPGDKIDFSAMDANGCASGNQSFTLVSDAFSGRGQLMIKQEIRDGEDYTVVEGNTTGGPDADFKLSIKGSHELNASDFNL
ncbi:M10 family metallopeptidase C-terminal domain-containing protein [Nitratireductor aquimarinus]|nr:M10 family metallopeptidase C-terminal domain-containing protein [Nitratireductor aquimarinus]MBY6021757.1 M10 family metallopeptidase C-terminal domain-containing protein [Nitratireductor sp. DP7N14-4]